MKKRNENRIRAIARGFIKRMPDKRKRHSIILDVQMAFYVIKRDNLFNNDAFLVKKTLFSINKNDVLIKIF